MDSTAILSRTNLGLRPFEQALTEAGVPYHLVGKSGFWSQPEVRTVLAFLQAAVWPSDYALGTCIRSPFWIAKFLPKSKLLAALKVQLACEVEPRQGAYFSYLTRIPQTLVEPKNLEALSNFTSFIHSLSRYKSLAAADALKQILGALRAGDYYSEEEANPDNDPLGNLAELVKMAGRFQTIKEFLDYCRKVTAASKSRKGVALSTVHSFKGAEADVIYVVGVSDGVLPHAKATDLQEERNIWFTACSRPRHRLVITYSGPPSPFLKGMKCVIMEPKKERTDVS